MNTATALYPSLAPSATTLLYVQQPQQNFNGRDLMARFIDFTDRKETTTKNYAKCIGRFLSWLADNGIAQPQRDDIKAYRDFLASSGYSTGTQQQYLRSVKHFFRWTAQERPPYYYPNIADNIHPPKVRHDIHKKDALGREDVPIVAESIDRSTENGKRLYAMYLLAITGGLRTIEISRADVGDIKTVGGRTYLYVWGKGHDDKDAPILIIPEVKEAIQEYLSSRPDKYTAKSPLFVASGNKGRPGTKIYKRDDRGNYVLDENGKKIVDHLSDGRMTPTSISALFKEMLVKAGYDSDRITAHSIRHTSGTGAYKATHNIYLAQKHQRHTNASTTEIYVHAEERQERDTEQQVYNYYFRAQDPDSEKERAMQMLANLSPDEVRKVIDFMNAIK